jgi:hypothetical protein
MKEVKAEYVPYGTEWEKEVFKIRKASIIKMFGDAMRSKDVEIEHLQEKIRRYEEGWGNEKE